MFATGNLHPSFNQFPKSFVVSGHARLHRIRHDGADLLRWPTDTLFFRSTCALRCVATSSPNCPFTLNYRFQASFKLPACFGSFCSYRTSIAKICLLSSFVSRAHRCRLHDRLDLRSAKVQALREINHPQTHSELGFFLGLRNVY